jgi:hypothetical protein
MKKLVSVLVVLSMLVLQLQMFSPIVSASESIVSGDTILAEEDFSDTTKYTLNTPYLYTELAGKNDDIVYTWSNLSPGTSKKPFTVKPIDEEDLTKGNYMEFGHGNAHVVLGADFDTVTKGTLVTEFKIRIPDDAKTPVRNVAIATFVNSANQTANTMNYIGAGNATSPYYEFRNKTDGNPVFGTSSTQLKNELSKDEYGFYSLKLIWSRATESDNWDVKVCDALNNDAVMLHAESFAFTDIIGVWFGQLWETTGTNAPIDFADLKVYIPDVKDSTVFKDIVFSSNSVPITSLSADATELSVSLTMKDTDIRAKSYSVILAVYEKDGTIEGIDSVGGITTEDGNSKQISLGLENLELDEGAYAKLFFWRGLTTLCPLGVPEELPAAGF